MGRRWWLSVCRRARRAPPRRVAGQPRSDAMPSWRRPPRVPRPPETVPADVSPRTAVPALSDHAPPRTRPRPIGILAASAGARVTCTAMVAPSWRRLATPRLGIDRSQPRFNDRAHLGRRIQRQHLLEAFARLDEITARQRGECAVERRLGIARLDFQRMLEQPAGRPVRAAAASCATIDSATPMMASTLPPLASRSARW